MGWQLPVSAISPKPRPGGPTRASSLSSTCPLPMSSIHPGLNSGYFWSHPSRSIQSSPASPAYLVGNQGVPRTRDSRPQCCRRSRLRRCRRKINPTSPINWGPGLDLVPAPAGVSCLPNLKGHTASESCAARDALTGPSAAPLRHAYACANRIRPRLPRAPLPAGHPSVITHPLLKECVGMWACGQLRDVESER